MRETENRPYVITDYAIPEQEIMPISEDMWLIPFVAQGSDDVFIHILIEKDGVYRLQRLQEMMD